MMDCDTLITVGANFPYTLFMLEFGQAGAGSIELDSAMIGLFSPYEENVVGDAQATVVRLIRLMERKRDRSWQDDAQGRGRALVGAFSAVPPPVKSTPRRRSASCRPGCLTTPS